jgi:hypothetical protein
VFSNYALAGCAPKPPVVRLCLACRVATCRNLCAGVRATGLNLASVGRPLSAFGQAVERGIGFNRSRIDSLRLAHHETHGQDLGKNVVKKVLEHGRGIELSSAAHG